MEEKEQGKTGDLAASLCPVLARLRTNTTADIRGTLGSAVLSVSAVASWDTASDPLRLPSPSVCSPGLPNLRGIPR